MDSEDEDEEEDVFVDDGVHEQHSTVAKASGITDVRLKASMRSGAVRGGDFVRY